MKLPSEAVAPYLYVHGQFDTLDKVRQYEAEIVIELENRRIRTEKAEKELCELKERTRWIPLSERLPEVWNQKNNVLLTDGTDSGEGFLGADGKFYFCSGLIIKATHWQPLPLPPTE